MANSLVAENLCTNDYGRKVWAEHIAAKQRERPKC